MGRTVTLQLRSRGSASFKNSSERRRRRATLLLLLLSLFRSRTATSRSRQRQHNRRSSRLHPSCTNWEVRVAMTCCPLLSWILSPPKVSLLPSIKITNHLIAQADDSDDEPELRRIGTYVLKETLGEGGFGKVYRACPSGKSGSSVALKAKFLFTSDFAPAAETCKLTLNRDTKAPDP